MDDIIFGATKYSLCDEFARLIRGNFEMSIMEELTYFLRHQINQEKEISIQKLAFLQFSSRPNLKDKSTRC